MKSSTFTARVANLVARAELPPVKCWEDQPDKRIKIQFQLEPDHATKALLRHHGFMWRAGTTQAWCRRLDDPGRRAARVIIAQLAERTEEDNR